jgi:S-(hydroxymethyl)glutathione dehydrogenase/alcohol dehydrogenase
MKALVFHKPRDVRVEDVPEPKIQDPRDAILRVTSTAICGSDLHIFNGFFPQLRPMVLGHEFMGEVVALGKEVTNLRIGDRVVVPFPIACGHCWFCQRSLPVHCERSNPDHYGPEGALLKSKGGALFGYTDLYGGYDGGQAELVRVPYADFGPRKVPKDLSDDQVLFLTDILSTGFSAIEWAELQGGETVAVFGAGPVGLMAMKSAWLKKAARVIAVDILPYRLEMARRTANAEVVNAAETDPVTEIRARTHGRGADVCVDAVGMEADRSLLDKLSNVIHLQVGSMKVFQNCLSAVRRGGRVSVVGVYGPPYDNFPLGQIFDKGIRLNFGQALVHRYVDDLLNLIADNVIVAHDIITHKAPLSEGPAMFKIFNEKLDNCVKVILKP